MATKPACFAAHHLPLDKHSPSEGTLREGLFIHRPSPILDSLFWEYRLLSQQTILSAPPTANSATATGRRSAGLRVVCATVLPAVQRQLQMLLQAMQAQHQLDSVRTAAELQSMLATTHASACQRSPQSGLLLIDAAVPGMTDSLLLDIVERSTGTHRVAVIDARRQLTFGIQLLGLGAVGFIDPHMPDELLAEVLRHHLRAVLSNRKT